MRISNGFAERLLRILEWLLEVDYWTLRLLWRVQIFEVVHTPSDSYQKIVYSTRRFKVGRYSYVGTKTKYWELVNHYGHSDPRDDQDSTGGV